MITRNPKRGFTLIEALVAMLTFMVFATTLLAILLLGMQYMQRADAEILTQMNCRNALDYIVNELRQGVSNPDPGTSNPPSGFYGINPSVEPTAVLMPNANTKVANYILFTEINPDRFPPSPIPDPFFLFKNEPSLYQRIRYYTNNGILYRERVSINPNGTLNPPETEVILQPANGDVVIEARFLGSRRFEVTVIVTEDKGLKTERTYSAVTTVSIIAR